MRNGLEGWNTMADIIAHLNELNIRMQRKWDLLSSTDIVWIGDNTWKEPLFKCFPHSDSSAELCVVISSKKKKKLKKKISFPLNLIQNHWLRDTFLIYNGKSKLI